MALHTMQSTGDSANRIDLVVLGDGYRAAELATTYTQHTQGLIDYIFSDSALAQPLGRYRNFFNVHRIDVVSAQSGADDPATGTVRDTALNSTFRADGVTDRLLSLDGVRADAAAAAGLAGTGITAEMRFVTVNTTTYGGSGGNWAVFAGGNLFAREVALHEVAHSFARLADEYGGSAGVPYTGVEPGAPNVTKDPTGAKWAEWLGYDQPGVGVIGAYQGGLYRDAGIWRPSPNSKMRSLDQPFDVVSQQEFILRFYELVDPIDSHTPTGATLTNRSNLRADVIDPAVIQVDWSVNGTPFVAVGETFDLDARGYTFGTYTVVARAHDTTAMVRGDRSSLEQTIAWTVVNDWLLRGTTLAEVLNGTANANDIRGSEGADTLVGLAGDDQLEGGLGADSLTGGDGYDVAGYARALSSVEVSLQSGGGTGGEAIGDMLSGIESLLGSGFADRLTGNDDHNIIEGGPGADTVAGLLGNDWVSFETAGAGIAINLDANLGWAGDATDDRVEGIENIRGSAHADYLFGDWQSNILRGDAGGDVLYGAANSDTIYYSTSTVPVAVDLSTNSALGGDAEGDTLVSVENVFATAYDDRLIGDSASNTLVGWYGRDTMTGNGSNDIFRWSSLGDSGVAPGMRDIVTDFYRVHGDLLDVSGIDANAATGVDEAFAFIAGAAFSAAGQLRFFSTGTGNTVVEVNVDASLAADLAFELLGLTALIASDFLL